MNYLKVCAETIESYGANESETLELLDYNQNVFTLPQLDRSIEPLPEPYLATWEEYTRSADRIGVDATLKSHLVQLQFPIQAGMSEHPEYRAATRRGESTAAMETAVGLTFVRPEALQLWLHPTLAGAIPVIATAERADFVSLVRALTKRNEPHPIPDSMGACIVGGYNNWHRVHQYKQQWLEQQQAQNLPTDWAVEFKHLSQRPELYQDRFILLSRGAYSNIPAAQLGLTESDWLDRSSIIRLEHECTHFITRRWFGSMRNNILDELIADYRGIVAACGSYRADWFLAFIGLEAFPDYRLGGRLENYLGEPPLSAGAFVVLQRLVTAAANHLERFDRDDRQSGSMQPSELTILLALSTLRLEELAADDGVERIRSAINSVRLG